MQLESTLLPTSMNDAAASASSDSPPTGVSAAADAGTPAAATITTAITAIRPQILLCAEVTLHCRNGRFVFRLLKGRLSK